MNNIYKIPTAQIDEDVTPCGTIIFPVDGTAVLECQQVDPFEDILREFRSDTVGIVTRLNEFNWLNNFEDVTYLARGLITDSVKKIKTAGEMATLQIIQVGKIINLFEVKFRSLYPENSWPRFRRANFTGETSDRSLLSYVRIARITNVERWAFMGRVILDMFGRFVTDGYYNDVDDPIQALAEKYNFTHNIDCFNDQSTALDFFSGVLFCESILRDIRGRDTEVYDIAEKFMDKNLIMAMAVESGYKCTGETTVIKAIAIIFIDGCRKEGECPNALLEEYRSNLFVKKQSNVRTIDPENKTVEIIFDEFLAVLDDPARLVSVMENGQFDKILEKINDINKQRTEVK